MQRNQMCIRNSWQAIVLLTFFCSITFTVPSCTPIPLFEDETNEYQETVNDIKAFHAKINSSPSDQLDIKDYCSVLTHLSYEDLEAERDYSDYGRYIGKFHIDDTAEGFFEFVVLQTMGGQVHLGWHGLYHDAQILCDQGALKSVLNSFRLFDQPFSKKNEALALDLEPVIEFQDTKVTVQVIIFTKWGGFIQKTSTIQREFPHQIIQENSKTLIKYDCGVMF